MHHAPATGPLSGDSGDNPEHADEQLSLLLVCSPGLETVLREGLAKAGLLGADGSQGGKGPGAVVRVVRQPAEALALLAEEPVDAVVLELAVLGEGPRAELDCRTLAGAASTYRRAACLVVLPQDASGLDWRSLARESDAVLFQDELTPRELLRSLHMAVARRRELIDLTSRSQAGAEACARLENLFESDPDGLLVADDEGHILFANPAARRLLGGEMPETGEMEPFGLPVIQRGRGELELPGGQGETVVVEVRARETTWQDQAAWLVTLRDTSARRRCERDLSTRVETERLVSAIAMQFIKLEPAQAEYGIRETLRRLGEFCAVDRVVVWLYDEHRDLLRNVYEWVDEGREPPRENATKIPAADLQWLRDRLEIYGTVVVGSLADLPAGEQPERELLTLRGVRSLLAARIEHGPRQYGILALESLRRERMFSEEEIGLLQLVAEVLAQALTRSQRETRTATDAAILEQLMDTAPLGVLVEDAGRRVVQINTRACEMVEPFTSPDDLVGRDAAEVLGMLARVSSDPDRAVARLQALAEQHAQVLAEQVRMSDGRVLELDSTPVSIAGEERGHLWLLRDVTVRVQAERRLEGLVRRDVLTGLSSRHRLIEDLAIVVSEALETRRLMAVLLIDLDGFRGVNGQLGFVEGDKILKMAVERIHALVGARDLLGRLSGDEFCLVLTTPADQAEAEHVARRLVWSMAQPFELGRSTVSLGASVGVSLFPAHGESAGELLQNADIALVQAKEQGKGNYQVLRAGSCPWHGPGDS